MTGPERRRAMARGMSAKDRAYVALRNRASDPLSSFPRAPPPPVPTETKYFDTTFNAVIANAADWTGTEVPMTSYIQSDGTTVGAYTDCAIIPSAIGAGYGQVNGNKYYIKKIRIKGELNAAILSDQADVPTSSMVRITVVQDLQPQGAQIQGEQIFTDLGSVAAVNHSFLAMAAGSGGRVRILKDKMFVLDPTVAGTDGASTNSCARQNKLFKFSISFKKPLQVILKASSATPTVASLSNHNIFILAHSNNGTISIVGAARCYFVD